MADYGKGGLGVKTMAIWKWERGGAKNDDDTLAGGKGVVCTKSVCIDDPNPCVQMTPLPHW